MIHLIPFTLSIRLFEVPWFTHYQKQKRRFGAGEMCSKTSQIGVYPVSEIGRSKWTHSDTIFFRELYFVIWVVHQYQCFVELFVDVLTHRFECLFLEPDCVNFLQQTSQQYDLSAVCVWRCVVKSPFLLNAIPQSSHLWGFSPVWMSWWPFKVLLWAKDFPHTSQENGFSPVCVRRCWVRTCFNEQVYSHTPQEKGRSPVCMRVWRVRLEFFEHVYVQWEHAYSLSPVWDLMWRFSSLLREKDLPQCEQT